MPSFFPRRLRAGGASLLAALACAETPTSSVRPSVPEALVALQDDAPADPSPVTVVVQNPCDDAGARFGSAVAIGDLDGDGKPELVVGADGHGVVHVFRRVDDAFQPVVAYQQGGPATCPVPPRDDTFGRSLAVGNLTGDAADEVLVGAPQIGGQSGGNAGTVFLLSHVLGDTLQPIQALPPAAEEEGLYGNSLAVGDFDGDGHDDVAVGAPAALVGGVAAGTVVVHFGPIGDGSARLTLPNPFPVVNGNYGHALATADWNGDGVDDLVVSAIGNTVGGRALAGQVLVYPGPLDAGRIVALEDPVPVDGDIPRFGMHIAARGPLVAVGSPRKDWDGKKDAGLAVVFDGAHGGAASLFPHPSPFQNAVHGYRVVLADVFGNGGVDLGVATLPKAAGATDAPRRRGGGPQAEGAGPQPFDNRGLNFWSGAVPGTPLHQAAIEGSEDHFPQGITVGQLLPGGKEELVLGDPTWDRAGQDKKDDSGRVVLHLRVH